MNQPPNMRDTEKSSDSEQELYAFNDEDYQEDLIKVVYALSQDVQMPMILPDTLLIDRLERSNLFETIMVNQTIQLPIIEQDRLPSLLAPPGDVLQADLQLEKGSPTLQGSQEKRGRKARRNDPSCPFICQICDGCFKRSDNLKRHQNAVHRMGKRLKCNSCEYFAFRIDYMQSHFQTNHPEKGDENGCTEEQK